MNKPDWYLPRFLKDFHDQKTVFKAINGIITDEDRQDYYKEYNWIMAHCYTIDKFLPWMAQHGYTLQKNRKKTKFKSLKSTLAEFDKNN